MTAAYDEVPFSELLHKPASTAGRLDHVRALRLRRRDAGDLALMRIEQLAAEGTVVDFTARLLAGLVNKVGVESLRSLLPDAVPWAAFLPADDLDEFAAELVTVAQGATALANLAPLATLIAQWRHTAEVYADPALFELITREPEGDLGPVPAPDALEPPK
ncbi:DUF6247 family protein [Nocardia donostiensis]|uniref:Prevent-host-death family protein n=1 Tax=Nocardia donostiensis TaxID=1538463 RepID=A0A1W0AY41_9NOCA|nr:DUF6247 family protein [Nocardia donostiensis]ONM47107.1 hypothetical protein B0T46_19180 [Nocardia donostiensis]OQS15223.1 hypothetical protein B0T36_11320 [Nocardia donostiensis]OQS20092.1 hypothetical protein B0T44_11170 [Nocardia donostiensis]